MMISELVVNRDAAALRSLHSSLQNIEFWSVSFPKPLKNTRISQPGVQIQYFIAWIPQPGVHRQDSAVIIPEPGFRSQDCATRITQPRFLSYNSSARIPQPGFQSPDVTAMIPLLGFHSQIFIARIPQPVFHSQAFIARMSQPGLHNQDSQDFRVTITQLGLQSQDSAARISPSVVQCYLAYAFARLNFLFNPCLGSLASVISARLDVARFLLGIAGVLHELVNYMRQLLWSN